MVKKESRKQRIKKKLTNKFRLVILNEETFEERFSVKLSRLNVFVFGGIFSFLLIAVTTVLIAFTSLKEYIPGYASTKLKKQATRVSYETDSLKIKIKTLQNYTKSLQAVLKGEIKPDAIDSLVKTQNTVDDEKLKPTDKVLKFREKTTSKDRFSVEISKEINTENAFFTPLNGTVSDGFNSTKKHFAIDVVAKKGTPVKAIANGTVIMSEWTADTGYVITIQHTNDFVSIYKHNGALLKEQGDQVKIGEVIAEVGSTGELTTGPHLHFELWNKGFPVNPKDYINFE